MRSLESSRPRGRPVWQVAGELAPRRPSRSCPWLWCATMSASRLIALTSPQKRRPSDRLSLCAPCEHPRGEVFAGGHDRANNNAGVGGGGPYADDALCGLTLGVNLISIISALKFLDCRSRTPGRPDRSFRRPPSPVPSRTSMPNNVINYGGRAVGRATLDPCVMAGIGGKFCSVPPVSSVRRSTPAPHLPERVHGRG